MFEEDNDGGEGEEDAQGGQAHRDDGEDRDPGHMFLLAQADLYCKA